MGVIKPTDERLVRRRCPTGSSPAVRCRDGRRRLGLRYRVFAILSLLMFSRSQHAAPQETFPVPQAPAWEVGDIDRFTQAVMRIGQRAYMALLPRQRVGVTVLTNTQAMPTEGLAFIAEEVFDHQLGKTPRNHLVLLRQIMERRRQQWASEQAAPTPAHVPLQMPATVFEGRYRDRLGLEIQISVEADHLRLTYGGGEAATLEYRGNNVFITHWDNPWHDEDLATTVSFAFDANGRAARLAMQPFDDSVEATRIEERP